MEQLEAPVAHRTLRCGRRSAASRSQAARSRTANREQEGCGGGAVRLRPQNLRQGRETPSRKLLDRRAGRGDRRQSGDRKRVGEGKRGEVRLDNGGRRSI